LNEFSYFEPFDIGGSKQITFIYQQKLNRKN